jgi:hypothetical protein
VFSEFRVPAIVLVAVFMLAGCSGSQNAPASVLPQGAITQPLPPASAHVTRDGSWMLPEATSEDLLYIADYGGGVIVYSYGLPRLKYVGHLAAPLDAEGECVDKEQDVFITDSNYEIYEYAHGAANPKAILTDSFANPSNCASDPITGNLAVVGYAFGSKSKGAAIFERARGKPKLYPAAWNAQACGYDDEGDLFMDGNGNEYINFAELRKGATKFTSIHLNQSFSFAGGVQWGGKYVAVGDYYGAIIYEFRIAGSTGTEVESTPLSGSGAVWQFFIDRARGKVIAPSTFQNYAGFVKTYDYPAGGSSHGTLNFGSPYGVVVSVAR